MSIKLDIYVESCGTSNSGEADFHWRKINSDNDQPREEPPILREKIIERGNGEKGEVEILLHKEEPSLVLVRYENKLLLQVTVPSSKPERRKKYSRVVRNSVAWLGEANLNNESALRMLAVRMLKTFSRDDSLIKEIDEAVDFDAQDTKTFKVSFEKIAQLTSEKKLSKFEIVNNELQNSEFFIKSKSDDEIQKLKSELKNHCLPKKDGPLVVVTEIPPVKGILHEAGVWRGLVHEVALSSSQNSNEGSSASQLSLLPESISSAKTNQETEDKVLLDTKQGGNPQEQNKKNLNMIFLIVIVLVSLIIAIVSLHWVINKGQERPQKIQRSQINKSMNSMKTSSEAMNSQFQGSTDILLKISKTGLDILLKLPENRKQELLLLAEFLIRQAELEVAAQNKSLTAEDSALLERVKDVMEHLSSLLEKINTK